MYLKKIFLFIIIFVNLSYADDKEIAHTSSLYIGAGAGYGSTTWAKLVPNVENQNFAINLSAPINVREGGGVWGGFFGYEVTNTFALEINYMHFPNVDVAFDETSLFSFLHDGLTAFTTHTETVNLMAKIMLSIPDTKWRIYSSLGIAELHREDILKDGWLTVPTFGAGLNYRFSPHIMAELNGNYTAGYGESQLNPSEIFFPFLYAVFARIAYIF